MPASALRAAQERIKELERALGKKAMEIEILQAAISLHVPVGESAIRWIPQQDQKLELIVVVPDSLHGGSPIDVNWSAGAEQSRFAFARTAPLQRRVINLRSGKPLFVIKKMASWLNGTVQLVFVRHLDFWMPVEKIGQRAGSSFLRAGDDEIQFCSWWTFEFEEHRNSSDKVG